jgi:hypothetical protein
MKTSRWALCCLLTSLIPAGLSQAAETTLQLSNKQRRDIDFDTSTLSIGAKAITSAGLFTCDVARETGESRIDTFDNIFGTQSVLTTTWNGYEADQLQCGYGMKIALAGGELSAGIGMMQYRGETDTTDDGKKVELDALRVSAQYVHGDYDTRVQLLERQYDYLYHYLVGAYDSDTNGRIRNVSLTGEWGPVHAEAEHLQGYKEKDFTTSLLPYADFNYNQTTVSLGPSFNGSMGALRYIAPTYTSGSERGSFSRLGLDNGIRGAVVGMLFGETKARLSYLNLQGAGRRDYSPVTTDLAESQHSTALVLELEAAKWSLKLENRQIEKNGYITITTFPYDLMVGCSATPCSYNNYREEDELTFSGRYTYSPLITLHGELYQRRRKDQQYEAATRNYLESGGEIGLSVTF